MSMRVISILIFFLIAPLILSAANPSELEQQIERVRRERETLVEEQKKLQVELEEINKESQTLGSAVKSLDATKKKLVNDMSEKEKQIITHRTAIASAILALSEYDTNPLILQILASVRLSDLWRDGSQLAGLNARLEEEINALRETRKILDQEKAEKEKVKKEQLN